MEEPDPRVRAQLRQAAELFGRREYAQSKKLLRDLNLPHPSVELDLLLCDFSENPTKPGPFLKKMLDILTAINIKLYRERPKGRQASRPPRISHELYYWNAIVAALLLNNPECAELLASEALHYTDAMRTETALMLVYHMLRNAESSHRLATCVALIDKQNKLVSRLRRLSREEQVYRFLNQILFNKVLLKLDMLEASKIMFMMKFNQGSPEDEELKEIGGIPVFFHQKILHAQIEYHSGNLQQSAKYLAEMMPELEKAGRWRELVRHIIDHNMGVLVARKQPTAGQLMIGRCMEYMREAGELEGSTERAGWLRRCQENLVLCGVISGTGEGGRTGMASYSYKINYRKAQLCLNEYHQTLARESRSLPWAEVHDQHETIYHHPNEPYFQHKGKNKNPNYTNGVYYYRRYALPPSNPQPTPVPPTVPVAQPEQEKKEVKDPPKKEGKKNAAKSKKNKKVEEEVKEEPKEEANEAKAAPRKEGGGVLEEAAGHLRSALQWLQREKGVVVGGWGGEEASVSEQVNEKLHGEYLEFKGSILELLCYVALCRQQWRKALHYASLYSRFEKHYHLSSLPNPRQKRTHYNVLTYRVEALAQLSQHAAALEEVQNLMMLVDHSSPLQLRTRSTNSTHEGHSYCESMSQTVNFLYNLAVLHCRGNQIPQAHAAIQKLLQQLRGGATTQHSGLPLSAVELLSYYNTRTGNPVAAVQVVRHRRVGAVPGMMGQYPLNMSITK